MIKSKLFHLIAVGLKIFATKVIAGFKKLKSIINTIMEGQEVYPRQVRPAIIMYIFWIITLIVFFCIESYLPKNLSGDAVKAAMTVEITASATIMGLFIATLAFSRRTVVDREQQLATMVFDLLKELETDITNVAGSTHTIRNIDLIYEGYRNTIVKINKHSFSLKKHRQKIYLTLGRLWALKELSKIYQLQNDRDIPFYPHRGQIKELRKINKLCAESAVSIWSYYNNNYPQFILDTIKALNYAQRIIENSQIIDDNGSAVLLRRSAQTLPKIVKGLVEKHARTIAYRINRIRKYSNPLNITVLVSLSVTIITGIITLLGLKPDMALGQIPFVMIVSIICAVFGLAFTILTIISTILR